MARYEPIDMVNHYRGKICSHSDTYFQKRGNTLCTGRICNPRDLSKHPLSADEIAVRDKFRQARAGAPRTKRLLRSISNLLIRSTKPSPVSSSLKSTRNSATKIPLCRVLGASEPRYVPPPSLSGARRVRAEVCSFRPHWMRTLY